MKHHTKMTFVIADDDAIYLYYLEELLLCYDCVSISAGDGKEAVEKCLNNKVDGVFMDIEMPKMNGFRAASIIKSYKPSLQIIAHSSFFEYKFRADPKLFSVFILKPLKKDDLLQVLF